jgi:hypothetical protein
MEDTAEDTSSWPGYGQLLSPYDDVFHTTDSQTSDFARAYFEEVIPSARKGIRNVIA